MSPEIHWQEIALRLALTVIAGGLLAWSAARQATSPASAPLSWSLSPHLCR
jgi:hypothetical protein